MTVDLDQLATLARAATPGPWAELDGYFGARTVAIIRSTYENLSVGLLADGSPWDSGQANRAYIAAANPSVVLALVERARALEAMQAEWARLKGLEDLAREQVDRWRNGTVHRTEAEVIDAMERALADAAAAEKIGGAG